jgi:hypothetical protein
VAAPLCRYAAICLTKIWTANGGKKACLKHKNIALCTFWAVAPVERFELLYLLNFLRAVVPFELFGLLYRFNFYLSCCTFWGWGREERAFTQHARGHCVCSRRRARWSSRSWGWPVRPTQPPPPPTPRMPGHTIQTSTLTGKGIPSDFTFRNFTHIFFGGNKSQLLLQF